MSPLTEPTRLILKRDSVAATDTNIREVSLLLHGNGVNGSTTITDSSLSPKTVTAVGNAQVSTAQSRFGGASIAFDGTGDYLTVSGQSFPVGTESFTVEFWIYSSAAWNTKLGRILENPVTGGFQVYLQTDNTMVVSFFAVSAILAPSLGSLALSTWHHVAIVRNGSLFSVFFNGILQATATDARAFSAISSQVIGSSDSFGFNGYIDDLRITKGVARYTSNFTPPTAPFPDF